MTAKRNRRKQTQSLQERLAAFAESSRERARSLPPGRERALVLAHRIELWRLDRRIAQFDLPREAARQ